MRNALSLLCTVLLAAVLVGCTSQKVGVAGKPREFQRPLKLISLSPSTTELISGVGYPSQHIIGRTSNCNYPQMLTNAKIVVAGTKPDFEKIASLEPEYIIYEKSLYSDTDIAKIKTLAPRTVEVNVTTWKEYEDMVVKLSKDVGTETAASEYLDKIYAAVSVLEGNVPEGTSLTVLMGNSTTGYMALGTKTVLADLLGQANIKLLGPDSTRYEKVSTEQIIGWNPSVLVGSTKDASSFLSDPALAGLESVKKRKVLGTNPDLLFRTGGRYNVLIDGLATSVGRIKELKGN